MPLMPGKSKKDFSKNVSTEMQKSGKPQKQALAIAFSVQRHAKKKKMAYGGAAENDNNPGTPKAKADDVRLPQGEYMAEQFDDARDAQFKSKTENTNENNSSVKSTSNKASFAYGGEAQDTTEPGMPSKKPDNRRLDPKDYMSEQWAGGPDPERKPDDQRPSEDEYMNDHFGGDPAQRPMKQPPGEDETIRNEASDNANDAKYAKGGKVMNPKLQQSHMSPDEDADEHYASIADAILAKKKKARMYAEGGEVINESLMGDSDDPEGHTDITRNAQEQPNRYYKRNEDEVLKENYDDDFMHSAQPEDSNEHSDSIDSDAHDMVSAIRKKMKYKRSDLG